MTRYNSLEVSEKLLCNEPETYYETTAFFLHHIAFTAPVAFFCCINDRDGYSYGLIFFHVGAHIEYWRLYC